jgi:hypothetical protein
VFKFVPSRWLQRRSSEDEKSEESNLTRLVILEPSNLMRKWLLDEGPLGKKSVATF